MGAGPVVDLTVPVTARVLVVDDDRDIRALLAARLRRAGYDVFTASDGDEALRVAGEFDPDVVFLDVNMPGRDGFDVCRELVAGRPTPPAVIFLTAQGNTDKRVTGLEAGAVDYIVKPFDFAELTARMRAALRMKLARDQLAAAVVRDGLTGLLNRRGVDERAAELVAVARRYARPLSGVLVDVDHFKRVNDAHGHAAGDVVLREVAARLRGSARAADVLGRYGGEEFVVLLPETPLAGGVAVAEKLATLLRAAPIAVGPALAVPVTASFGVTALVPEMTGPEQLYAAADAALYRAKHLGGDRIEVATT